MANQKIYCNPGCGLYGSNTPSDGVCKYDSVSVKRDAPCRHESFDVSNPSTPSGDLEKSVESPKEHPFGEWGSAPLHLP